MNTHRAFLMLALLVPIALTGGACVAPQQAPALTADDRTFLDGLMKEFLFDPRGAERAAVRTVIRTVWAAADEVSLDGWLVPGQAGLPGRIYFADSAWVPAPPEKEIRK